MAQTFGVELLILADGWKAGEENTERLRLALVAAGLPPKDVYEIADELPEDFDAVRDDADVDFDYSAVEWEAGASPDDWAQMQQALASTSRVEVKGQEAGLPPGGPELPDVDFDREWT